MPEQICCHTSNPCLKIEQIEFVSVVFGFGDVPAIYITIAHKGKEFGQQ
jgi:hypothetical protein